MRSGTRVGLDALAEITRLMQRIRGAHPTAGLYEAADFQWWWAQRPRSTDELPQLFWFDDEGQPVAAITATEMRDHLQLDPVVLPDTAPAVVAHVFAAGLGSATDAGFRTISLEVDEADSTLRDVVASHGFALDDGGYVEAWLATDARPEVSPLPDGYRLASRADTVGRPHHMTNSERGVADPEPRLLQVSLYRPDLDLVVHGPARDVAAYGLFWYDPATATGLVEPMRTERAHQQLGLARHVLTAGIDLLARAGARRVKICYEPDNPASGHLYRSVGFRPDRTTVVYSRSPETKFVA